MTLKLNCLNTFFKCNLILRRPDGPAHPLPHRVLVAPEMKPKVSRRAQRQPNQICPKIQR